MSDSRLLYVKNLLAFPSVQEAFDAMKKRLKKIYVCNKPCSAQLTMRYEVEKWDEAGSVTDVTDKEIRAFFKRRGWDAPIWSTGPNKIVDVGLTGIVDLLTGASSSHFDNSNAYLGVGDSSTAAAAGQTDLQAALNKHWEGMEATYPTAATVTNSVAQTEFRAIMESGDAQFDWEEHAIANGASPPTDTMLGRIVQSAGTKGATAWTHKGFFSMSSVD